MKKGAFHWTAETQQAIDKLKAIMSTCIVIALPNFSRNFVLEYDSSEEGIGVVLMQYCHSIAFESQKLKHVKRIYWIYNKEILTIIHAFAKFRKIFDWSEFIVRTDHNNL